MMFEGSPMLGPELRVRSSRVILSRSGGGKVLAYVGHGTFDRYFVCDIHVTCVM